MEQEYEVIPNSPIIRKQKSKKANFFKQWLWKYVKEAAVIEESQQIKEILRPADHIISTSSNSLDSDKGIRFQIYKATGGMIIETNFYDRLKDRHQSSLYVITDDKDLGLEISKILTLETLKQ